MTSCWLRKNLGLLTPISRLFPCSETLLMLGPVAFHTSRQSLLEQKGTSSVALCHPPTRTFRPREERGFPRSYSEGGDQDPNLASSQTQTFPPVPALLVLGSQSPPSLFLSALPLARAVSRQSLESGWPLQSPVCPEESRCRKWAGGSLWTEGWTWERE